MHGSTEIPNPAIRPGVGRKRINAVEGERLTARFREGTLDRIKATLGGKEPLAEFLRTAVERELARREE